MDQQEKYDQLSEEKQSLERREAELRDQNSSLLQEKLQIMSMKSDIESQYEMMKGALDKSKNDYDFEKTRADGLENRLKEAELREADLRRKIQSDN